MPRRPSARTGYAIQTAGGTRVVVRGQLIAPDDAGAGLTVEAGPGELRPGLINAHDHLYLNHYARLGAPPYRNAYDWGRDLHARFGPEIQRAGSLPRRDALLFGALKNLLGAATTVVHHDPWDAALDGTFPVRVSRVRVAHSLGFEHDFEAALAGEPATRARPFSMHLAEGLDQAAADEVRECGRRGLLNGELLAVHAVGIDDDGVRRLSAAGAAVIWCPTSNRFLFGRTAPASLFQGGIDVLLGTDSLLTADGTLLDELRAAHRLGCLNDQRLADAVGRTAARRLGLPNPALTPGQPADVVLLGAPLFQAGARDVRLVVVGGVPRLGDRPFQNLFDFCGVRTEVLAVGGVPKLVAAPLASIARKAFELTPESARIVA